MSKGSNSVNESTLFIELAHRLRHYDDALVLYAALTRKAEKHELKTSATNLALRDLQGQLSKKQVQRSLIRLRDHGLLELRTRDRHLTQISIDPEALRSFLGVPMSPRLPGLADDSIAFLDDWNRQASKAAAKAIKNMKKRPSSDE